MVMWLTSSYDFKVSRKVDHIETEHDTGIKAYDRGTDTVRLREYTVFACYGLRISP